MKLSVKKIYCPGCQKLVRGREETVNNRVRIFCRRCGRPIWLWDGVTWRYSGKDTMKGQSLVRSH